MNKKQSLRIVGLGGYEDMILVEFRECGAEYELEPDGFGLGGMEIVAQMIDKEGLSPEEAAAAVGV